MFDLLLSESVRAFDLLCFSTYSDTGDCTGSLCTTSFDSASSTFQDVDG